MFIDLTLGVEPKISSQMGQNNLARRVKVQTKHAKSTLETGIYNNLEELGIVSIWRWIILLKELWQKAKQEK